MRNMKPQNCMIIPRLTQNLRQLRKEQRLLFVIRLYIPAHDPLHGLLPVNEMPNA